MKKTFVNVLSLFVLIVGASFAEDEAPPSNWKEILQRLEKKIETQDKRIEQMEQERKQAPLPAPVAPQPAAVPAQPPVQLEKQPCSPAQPIRVLGAGANYMNMSFDALFDFGWSSNPDVTKLQGGDHDPQQRGFSLRNAEISLDGAVDPYLKGFANIVWKLENDGESAVELEEAYALTTSLPWNLQAKAGQFFAEFGRINPTHPHTWAFVDQPLALNRLFGGDGLRSQGVRVSWLAPTPFYTEVMLGMFNGQGRAAQSFRNDGEDDGMGTLRFLGHATTTRVMRGVQDLMFVPRIASSFDLSDTQTVVLGLSGAFGPNNTGTNTDTQIYGADVYWKWRPATAQSGWPFVSWQTEALYRRFEAGADSDAGLAAGTLADWGFYSQLLWGYKYRWVAGLRGEFVSSNHRELDPDDPMRVDRTRVSPSLTWYPTEFSKLRLQYNHDWIQGSRDENSVWLQLEFLLGAHGAHKF